MREIPGPCFVGGTWCQAAARVDGRTPTAALRASPNQNFPQRATTAVDRPRQMPMTKPEPRTTPRCDRARVNAGRIRGRPGGLIAYADTAFK